MLTGNATPYCHNGVIPPPPGSDFNVRRHLEWFGEFSFFGFSLVREKLESLAGMSLDFCIGTLMRWRRPLSTWAPGTRLQYCLSGWLWSTTAGGFSSTRTEIWWSPTALKTGIRTRSWESFDSLSKEYLARDLVWYCCSDFNFITTATHTTTPG